MSRVLGLVVVLVAGACGNPQKTAESCGDFDCPLGTAPYESRQVIEGIDLDLAFDPTTYEGEVAFKRKGKGECEYYCATIEPCDEGTFPVITEDCFTCGLVTPDGEVNQGACED